MFNSDPAWTPAQYRRIEERADEFFYATDDASLAQVVTCGMRHAFRNTRNSGTGRRHKTVRVENVDIDVKLAPLIKEIWAAGIRTSMSCEDNVPANYCWIEFTDQNELARFLDAVTNNLSSADDTEVLLGSRIQQLTNEFELQWLYQYNPIFDERTKKMTTEISVRFPCSDLECVWRCMQKHNNKEKMRAVVATPTSKKRKVSAK